MGGKDGRTLKLAPSGNPKTCSNNESTSNTTSRCSLPEDVITYLTGELQTEEEEQTTDQQQERKCAPAINVQESKETESSCENDNISTPEKKGSSGDGVGVAVAGIAGAYRVRGPDEVCLEHQEDDIGGETEINRIADAFQSNAPPPEVSAQEMMMANTTCITAELVESDGEEKDAPWKVEVDRLKKELDVLKENQSRIVMAEPLSVEAVKEEVQSDQDKQLNEAKEQPNFKFATSIYGREAEVAQLKQALQAVSSSKQLVLLSGGSGVGKSVLAQELKTEACHYVAGKYDAQKREQPYSAIAEACDGLLTNILLYKSSPDSAPYPYQEFRTKIRELMDENDTDLLQSIIPSLNRLVGESGATHDINYLEVRHRFQHAFKRFVNLLTSFGSPLVLVLDDLQWVDQPSLDLLTCLVTDADVPSFLLIACYRDNEVDDNHTFSKALEKWKGGQLNVNNIPVTNLSREDVCTLLQDLLSFRQQDTLALTQCVHSKTAGNPFYTKQFVLSLISQDILSFRNQKQEQQGWQCDFGRLQDAAQATENVVALLTDKLHKLPTEMQTILPRIACLGSRFEERTAQIVMGSSSNENDTDILGTCVKEGLIVDCGRRSFKWEHDKIMEAALLLVEDGKLDALKSKLGWLLLDKLSSEELSSHLFVVTNLLNAGTKCPRSAELVGLNLRSGKVSFEASAFESAGQFLKHGIELLPQDKWESQFDLSLDLYSTAAEAHYCSGEFQQSLEHCDVVLALTCCDLVCKQKVYNVRMNALAAQGQVADAIELAKQILKKFGIKFPRMGRGFSAMSGVMRIAMSVDKTTAKLERLLPVLDVEKKWAIYLTNKLAHFTYLCEPSLTPLAIVKGLDLTVKYGRTDMTSPILATIALILAGSVGDFTGGKKYAELAIKYMNPSVECHTLFMCYQFVFHYQRLTKDCLPYLERGYEVGMKTGDVDNAFWASYCVLEAQLHTGSPLPKLLDDCALFSKRTASHNQEMIGWSVQPCRQLVANLLNKDSRKHMLTGEYMDEDEFKKKIEAHAHYHHQLSRYRICAAFWFNQHELVAEIMEEFDYHNFSIEKATPGTNGIGSLYFQCAMSCIALAQQDKKKHAVQKKRARKFLAKLKQWVSKGNPNVQHYESLLEAELSSLKGEPSIVTAKHYDYAILRAEQQGLRNDHGLAHERFGDHCRRSGDEDAARKHYEKAIESYKEWGAMAKVAMVQDMMQ